MAIVIKGMDMPDRCSACFAYEWDYDRCVLYSNGLPKRYDLDDLSERPEWCELEEVDDDS